MATYMDKDYPMFSLFHKQWALVTAGTLDHYNSCTVSWGSFGTLWTRPDNRDGAVITVYIHPARYTIDFLKTQDTFTVSFFPPECKPALSYMGAHSGREGDKAAAAGLTPVALGDSVTFREATTTFLCRKLVQQPFDREALASSVQAYYRDNPKSFPPDASGQWEPHWLFVGEIVQVEE